MSDSADNRKVILVQELPYTTHWVDGELAQFVRTLTQQPSSGSESGVVTELRFPAGLSASLRKYIQATAPQLGLITETEPIGSGVVLKIVVRPEDIEYIHQAPPPAASAATASAQPSSPPNAPQSGKSKKKNKRYEKIPRGMTEIVPEFLYLGSGVDASDHAALHTHRISHVLNVAKGWNTRDPLAGVEYILLPLDDEESQDLTTAFKTAFQLMERVSNNKQRILVHCIMGMSRSASIVIGFLMYHQRIKLNAAFDLVWKKRSIVKPNRGFMANLLRLETETFPGAANSMEVERWVAMVGEHGSRMSRPHPTQKQATARPPPGSKKKGSAPQLTADSQTQIAAVLDGMFTRDFLKGAVAVGCEGLYEHRQFPKLSKHVRAILRENAQLAQILGPKGRWDQVLPLADQKLKAWYFQRVAAE